MPEISKCCGEDPEIIDHSYTTFATIWRYTFRCDICGHHIHSNRESLLTSTEIWNRSRYTINYVPAREAKFK